MKNPAKIDGSHHAKGSGAGSSAHQGVEKREVHRAYLEQQEADRRLRRGLGPKPPKQKKRRG